MEGIAERGSEFPIEGKCGSKLRGTDPPRYCTKAPMDVPIQRCRIHGGASLVGPAHPSFVDGKTSRYMPQRLFERFQAASNDPELLSTRRHVAIIAARVDELLEQVYDGASGQAAKEVMKGWEVFQKHRRLGNVAAMQEALEQLDEPIRRWRGHHAAWDELTIQMERHARLADQEQKRLEKIEATMGAEEGMAMVRDLVDIVKRHCTEEQQHAITAEFAQLVTGDARPIVVRGRRR